MVLILGLAIHLDNWGGIMRKLETNDFSLILIEALKFLRQKIQQDIQSASPKEIIKCAEKNWDIEPLKKLSKLELNLNQNLLVD